MNKWNKISEKRPEGYHDVLIGLYCEWEKEVMNFAVGCIFEGEDFWLMSIHGNKDLKYVRIEKTINKNDEWTEIDY